MLFRRLSHPRRTGTAFCCFHQSTSKFFTLLSLSAKTQYVKSGSLATMLRRPPESSSRHHRPTKLSTMLCTFQRLTLFSLNCFSKSLIIDVDIYRPLPSLETWNGCAPHSALSCMNCYQLPARALSMQGTRICKIYYSPPPASPACRVQQKKNKWHNN